MRTHTLKGNLLGSSSKVISVNLGDSEVEMSVVFVCSESIMFFYKKKKKKVKGVKRNGKCMQERTEACVGLLKLSPKSLEIQVPSTGREEKQQK